MHVYVELSLVYPGAHFTRHSSYALPEVQFVTSYDGPMVAGSVHLRPVIGVERRG